MPAARPEIDIVVPVYNEAAALERSVRRLHAFLRTELPFTWRVVIADNASTDGPPAIAERLAEELPGVAVIRLARKGRGRALRAAWSASRARVVAYMDVDLSTDLRALLPLVAPLISGHSDLAIRTRLARGARVVRGPKRELISRGYNTLLRTTLRARFSDAQCGFKAVRRDALDGLRGVGRLLVASQVARFMGIGVLSTLAYALLYLMLRSPLGAGAANALVLGLTAVGNTAANRRYTFGLRGRAGLVRQTLMGTLVYLLTLGLTSGALLVLRGLDADPARLLEVTVLVLSSLAATVTRFVALRVWVFAHRAPSMLPAHAE
jgi:glycosyltransferase involved in cell wall biosynthesis